MRSSTDYGQRKRRRLEREGVDSSGIPMLLRGGARIGRPRGAVDNQPRRTAGRGGQFVPAFGGGKKHQDRIAAHQYWNQLSDLPYLHFSRYTGEVEAKDNRIISWPYVMRTDQAGYNNFPNTNEAKNMWDEGIPTFNVDNPPEGWDGRINDTMNDLEAEGGQQAMSNFRMGEVYALQLRADYTAEMIGEQPRNRECLWAFLGMSDSPTNGPAWSTFYYAISDVIDSFDFMSDVVGQMMEMATDILAITQLTQHNLGNALCIVDVEGGTDPTDEKRDYLTVYRPHLSLNSIEADPFPVFDALLNMFQSDKNADFRFQRVFFQVLTQIGLGGSLRNMSPKLRALREGPFFKGIKGYQLIKDTDDCSCGLEALVWALSLSMRRMNKLCKAAEKTVPSICKEFKNFRKLLLGTKSKNGKAQMTMAKTKAELASYMGWVSGQPISHDQICTAVSKYAEKHELDIGVLILDALQPLAKYTANYDPVEKMPLEVLCIVHWQPAIGTAPEGSDTGHYDCMNSVNMAKWVTARFRAEQKMSATRFVRYSFKRFSVIPSNESDHKGQFCVYCKHWQHYVPNGEWTSHHGGTQKGNKVTCADCLVKFKSRACMDLHLIPYHGNSHTACGSSGGSNRLCSLCGQVHILSIDCSVYHCRMCYEQMPREEKADHACFIGYTSVKKCGRVRRVCYSDMEGTRRNGFHEAVCVASCYQTICMPHFSQLTKPPKCEECTNHYDNWDWFCQTCKSKNEMDLDTVHCIQCNEMKTSYYVGDTCLSEYMDWVMETFQGGSVVFHNGGRYDLQILIQEILTTGKYILASDAMRGSSIIFFTVYEPGVDMKKRKTSAVRFIDSYNFCAVALRSFPVMFDLKNTGKGRFPYELLNVKDWQTWDGVCPPPRLFGITEKEEKAFLSPDTSTKKLSKVRGDEIKEIFGYISDCKKEGKTWNALERLKRYTIQDTVVLFRGMEEFRHQFWKHVHVDPFHWVSLASAVAGAYRQPEYMPEKSIQLFQMPEREWQRQGLRGGRCEPFKLYWRKTKPSESFKWVDINSSYPYSQAYGFYPKGRVTLDLQYRRPKVFSEVRQEFLEKTGVSLLDVLHDPTGKSGLGLIECTYRSAKDTYIPIIPSKVKTTGGYMKNMFQNRTGTAILFLTVLAEAVKWKQVIVLTVKRIQFWRNTTQKLFGSYLKTLYASKVEASGWKKILNRPLEKITEEQKEEYLFESKKRGIEIDQKQIRDDAGKRSVAKMIANCVWGYMAQKPVGNENNWYDNESVEEVQDMSKLLKTLETDQDPRRMVGNPVGVGKYTRIRTTKRPEDLTIKEVNKKVAYHVGGQVPAYGLQHLTGRGLLLLHKEQPAYCDTDSIGYIYDSENPLHSHLPLGPYLGDWMDEYPDHEIVEYCSLGCKTYYIRMEDKKTGAVSFKGRFKGIPLQSSSMTLLDRKGEFAEMGMKEIKDLLFHALIQKRREEKDSKYEGSDESVEDLTYEFKYTNFFKRGPDFKIRQSNEKRSIRFTFDKRRVDFRALPENIRDSTCVDTLPLDDLSSDLTEDEVGLWWLKQELAEQKEK